MIRNLSTAELKAMTLSEAVSYCGEIREYLTEHVTDTGGHLASNLGIVEISVGIMRVFDPPRDRIIYDTGHQSYVHKLLTGRADAFPTLRTFGGLSGFTKRSESPYDPFGAGHCSTSLSAALGMLRGGKMRGDDHAAVAVIGDGAFSGGLVYEALNNIKKTDRIIIVLNDNEMSISRNVGLMAGYLNKIRTTDNYYKIKHKSERIISSVPLIGEPSAKMIRRVKNDLKMLILKNNLFEQLGIYYLGPADGNDLRSTETLLREAKRIKGPVIVHLCTKKGKGFSPAENDPGQYHSVKKYAECTPCGDKPEKKYTFTANFGRTVTKAAKENDNLAVITAAMCDGVGLSAFAKKFPDRMFDVGIAEEHGMTYAAGMAASGALPVFALYSTFFQRAFDQLFHDMALQELKGVIALDRCGLVGEDGPTHHGILDVSITLGVPNTVIYSPATLCEQRYALETALDPESPDKVYIVRYPKGGEDAFTAECFPNADNVSYFIPEGTDPKSVRCVIITYGRITSSALEAQKLLAESGICAAVVKILRLKPLDMDELYRVLGVFANGEAYYFLEEGTANGGFSQYLVSTLATDGKLYRKRKMIKTKINAIFDTIVPHGDLKTLFRFCSLDGESVARDITELLS